MLPGFCPFAICFVSMPGSTAQNGNRVIHDFSPPPPQPWRARHHPHTSRAAFALRVPIHCGTVLTTCTSLHIYIDEAIRVIAPVGGVPSREVRRDKCTVDGEALPVGINIEMVIYSICRRARYSERFHRFARRNGGYHAGRETSANRTGYSASM